MLKKFRYIQLEPTTFCNLRCNYCKNSLISQNHFDFELLIKIIPQMKLLTDHIHLQGLGEPYLHPQFNAILKEFKNYHFVISTTTNGVIINNESLDYLDEIVVSIDGITERANKNRRLSNLKTILSNIKLLKKTNKSKIGLSIVLGDHNVNEIEDLLMFAVKNKLDNIYISPVIDLDNNLKKNQIDKISLAKEISLEFISKLNISFSIPKEINSCRWLDDILYIGVDGTIKICCLRADSEHPSLGMITDDNLLKSLEEIYNDHQNQNFINNKSDEICSKCKKNGIPNLWSFIKN